MITHLKTHRAECIAEIIKLDEGNTLMIVDAWEKCIQRSHKGDHHHRSPHSLFCGCAAFIVK
jgi:hypothetical protein